MGLIYQTDPEFPPDIQHFGCLMMSMIERISTRFGFPFTHEWVLGWYRQGVNMAAITAEDYIADLNKFANLVMFNGWKIAEDVAQAVPRITYLGKMPADYLVTYPALFGIGEWHRPGADFNHFVSMEQDRVVYDPWSAAGSESVKSGSLLAKRVFKVLS